MTTFRRDIQFLRGIAVLLVVIYHSGVGVFAYGYLGVDVFFVLSGFLITKIILNGLDKGSFSFTQFYLRRAQRLLPALYSTLLFTSLFAYFILTPEQLGDYFEQFIGAISFSANMVLPSQIGYFADEAETKLLMHIWSLSLEEQYYFLLPAFLFLLKKEWRLPGLILATIASIAWCLSWVTASGSPPFLWRFGDAAINEWVFFLFPTRAWELLAGSISAWLMLRYPDISVSRSVKWIALFTICAVCTLGIDPTHPRGNAFLVVLATTLLVLGRDEWLPRSQLFAFIERVGDWSYSVYLAHWPLFVFAYLGFVEQVPVIVSVTLVALSIVLGYMQYHFVETPFRYNWQHPSGYVWRRLAIATGILLGAPLAVIGMPSGENDNFDTYAEVRKINYGLGEACEGSFEGLILKPECTLNNAPHLAVWGDSYAMHLVPGLAIANTDLVQLTKSVCGPVVGLAPIRENYNTSWAEACIAHNDRSLRYILDTESITHVVLSSTFTQYFGDDEGRFLLGEDIVPKDTQLAEARLVETIEELKRGGKQVILVSPPPRTGFNIGSCLERKDRGLITFRQSCDVNLEDFFRWNAQIIESLENVAKKTGTVTLWLHDLLCDDGKCRSRIGNTYVYRDGGHLSISGSEALLGNYTVSGVVEYKAWDQPDPE